MCKKQTLKRFSIFFLLLFVLGIAIGLNIFVYEVQGYGEKKVKVLIGFEQTPGGIERGIIEGLGGKVKYSYEIVPAIAAELPARAIIALERNPMVVVIEQDAEIYTLDYSNTWGVGRINADAVHSHDNFGENIKVGIVDTGIDYSHFELGGAYFGGYDFVNKSASPMDFNGHGTHVAGTVAAAFNEVGSVGVSPKVELYSLKVLSDDGKGNFSDVISALEWALENDVRVTNHSYGSYSHPGFIVEQAFENAYKLGLVHVAAAGNDGAPSGRGDNVGYPAKWDSVIAVAATDKNDVRAKWSSTGSTVEISAPGVNIYSTWLSGGFRTLNGTSMAASHVTGVVALILANNPELLPSDVRQILRSTATNIGNSNYYGSGLVNAFKAVYGDIPLDDEIPENALEIPEEEDCPPGLGRQGKC